MFIFQGQRLGIYYLQAEGFVDAPSQKTVDSVFNSCIAMGQEITIVHNQRFHNQLYFKDFVRLLLTINTVPVGVEAISTKE